jgi:hypothetical protein
MLEEANMKEIELAYETLEMQILQARLQRMGLADQVKQMEAKMQMQANAAPPGALGADPNQIPALPPQQAVPDQMTAQNTPPAPPPQAAGSGIETITPAPQAPQGAPV